MHPVAKYLKKKENLIYSIMLKVICFSFFAGEMIMNKWSNIRDSFLRSLRTKSGQGATKSYIYSDHLQFLLKMAQKDETESNFSRAGIQDDSITEDEEFMESHLPTVSTSRYAPKSTSQTQPAPSNSNEHRSKSKRQLDVIEREILTELKKVKQSDEPPLGNAFHSHHPRSDQEMLLLSFLPYTRDMSETELMDLQMEILTTIKKIKQRRVLVSQPPFQQQCVNVPLPSPSHCSDSYQSSQQSFAQSPPPSNQMEHQQEQPTQSYIQNYTGVNKYQQLFDQTIQ